MEHEEADSAPITGASASRVRPLISPEPFSGESNWTDWLDHFEAAATVNGWDDPTKLKWLPVRLTGKAQVAWRRLSQEAKASYDTATGALNKRFEPDSKRQLYAAEFQSRLKRCDEKWGDFADQLRGLADKAFPTLDEDAKELLTVDRYLNNISDPNVVFAVRQKRPQTVEEAVAATLEMESYLPQCPKERKVSLVQETMELDVGVVQSQRGIAPLLESIVSRLEKLEGSRGRGQDRRKWTPSGGKKQVGERTEPLKCFKCGQEGHYARGCASRQAKLQEN